MENIRIGNSVHVSWRLYNNNGSQYALSGKIRRLWIISAALEKEITSYGIQGRNEIVFSVPADDLIRYGTYKIRLTIRESESETEDATYDLTQIFQVVSQSYPNASNAIGGVADLSFTSVLNNVVIERIEGLSAYEIAVNNGYEGTEQEWIAMYDNAVTAANNAAEEAIAATETVMANEESRQLAESARDTAEQARMVSEQSRVSAERARAQAEQARQTAEQGRASSEQSRTIAETARVAAENARALAEDDRITSEQGRYSEELIRRDQEAERMDAETARRAAETARASAESARETAEISRNTAEQGRADAESARVTAEQGRVTAESGRVSAESARVTAEQSRRQQFEGLKTDMETAIDNVDAKSAEIAEDIEGYEANEAGRVSAENARATAESARVSAESARVSAESARATAENARVAQATSDHTRAETDHGTAESDHTTATGDHTQAGNDHIQAESDHSTAVSDHTQAEADHTASETATQAAIDAADAATEAAETIDEKIAEKADKDGYYGGMTVGSAENLVGRGSVEADYAGIRTSAGSADIGSGSASVVRMKGRSIVWNQLIQNGDFSNGLTGWFPALATLNVENGALSITAIAKYGRAEYVVSVTNHKYYIGATINAIDQVHIQLRNETQAAAYLDAAVVNGRNRYIFNISGVGSDDSVRIRILNYASSDWSQIVADDVQLIDLTQIFGSGNEPETVEEFDAWREEMGLTLDYYDRNEGEIINNRAQAIETVGYNLYDASTGKAFLPGKYSDYPQEYEICGTFDSISFTDVNGNTSTPTLTDGKFFNVDAPGELTVVGGNATDTLVHLVWSGWRNYGEPDYAYEAYWKNTLNLGLTTLTGKLNGAGESVVVFPNGLAKVGDIQDEIVGNKVIRRIGSRAYASGDESDDTVMTDGHALTYYELATPEEYILDETPEWNYRVDDFGTERVIPSYSSSEITAPIAYDVQYAMNAVDAIRRLDTNYVRRDNVKQAPGQSETDVLSQKAIEDNYARKVGVENDLVVGAAKALAGNQRQVKEFTTMVMEGADGIAKINEVRGRSIVWNQLVQNGDFSDGLNHWTQSGVVATVNADDVTIHATSESYTAQNFNQAIPTISGHKYFLSYIYKSDTVATAYFANANGVNLPASESFVEQKQIRTSSGFGVLRFYPSTGAQYSPSAIFTLKKHIVAFDLTQLFGAGSEPSTVAEFESWLANNIGYRDYYAYNPGEIISNNTEALEITGLNQWDEEWEVGIYNDGRKGSSGNQRIRCKNYIPCLPSTVYKETTVGDKSNTTYEIHFLNAGGDFISKVNVTNGTFETPSNCRYFVFCTASTYYGGTYLNNICINVSGSRNGEYEPYQKSELELNLATITGKLSGEGESVVIFPNGMRSAGTAFDSLIVDEDGWCRRAIKRVGGVDMGTLNWSRVKYNDAYFFRVETPFIKRILPVSTNLLQVVYEISTSQVLSTSTPNKTITCAGYTTTTAGLFVRDDSYSDAATFKSAMSGALLYYELETTEEYVLDTPIQMTFQAKHGGVIRQLPENGSEPTTAPIRMSVTYALDAVSILTDLPENYVSKESLQAMLSAMQTAGLFSAYTMTFNESTGKYEFTFTANA